MNTESPEEKEPSEEIALKDRKNLSVMDKVIRFCLLNKLLVFLGAGGLMFWGVMVAPFDWQISAIPRDPVPVDAIPDIGENQQIIFTKWSGRSPQDMEDQITYPLTTAMLGIPKVKTVRSFSMFGFSSIYVIFEEDAEFYWSRTRVLEKLNSLPAGTLPNGVMPMLGPDATALGQVFWYTLEGRDQHGKPAGGWDLQELRSIQDWDVRYSLLGAKGVSEVASVGGYVKEYQIDVDPDAMRAHGVSLEMVFNAVKMSNLDVGARTIEINKAEYVIRGIGFLKSLEDIENTVVKTGDNVPILVKHVATVKLGPALRRGVLDKEGAEVVGGVAVVRYGENPLATIKAIKDKIKNEIEPGLPSKVAIDFSIVEYETVEKYASQNGFEAFEGSEINQDAWKSHVGKKAVEDLPQWLTLSKVTVVPFYDRSGLIYETLGTLESALSEEILITIIVILVMMMHLRSSGIISVTLPFAVLLCFIAMKMAGVDANIVALSGIAIAIGTIVDMGVIICENILSNMDETKTRNPLDVVFESTSEVGGAVLTAVLTTVVSFLPVFTMEGAEGKLFKPLAFTKTFALISSVIVALTITPVLAHIFFVSPLKERKGKLIMAGSLGLGGLLLLPFFHWVIGVALIGFSLVYTTSLFVPEKTWKWVMGVINITAAIIVCWFLAMHWLPLGPQAGEFNNFFAVFLPVASLLIFFILWQYSYTFVLRQVLNYKALFLSLIVLIITFGYSTWIGVDKIFSWMPDSWQKTETFTYLSKKMPGLQKEFMPPLDEGSYLYMPTTMTHASIGEALDIMQKQDMGFKSIPEIDQVVGKLGRAETPLDPAPISMFETIINYKPEYKVGKDGHRLRFKFDFSKTDFMRNESGDELLAVDGKPYKVQGMFIRDKNGALIQDEDGMPFRNWRMALDPKLNKDRTEWAGINKPDDIWDEIVKAGEVLGSTSAPKLQPIAARIVMLQSGMRAPMGIKVKGPDLATIEAFGIELEKHLKNVEGVNPSAVIADRIVGKPYLEIIPNRETMARYGLHIKSIHEVIEIAIGGRPITTTVEGRERYPVRVRYQRELRDSIESIKKILVSGSTGQQIPLEQVAEIKYVRGPQVIKNEDTFLTGYVLFDKNPGYAEVDVVENAQRYLKQLEDDGVLKRPDGIKYKFSGSYENQIRAEKKLGIVLPLALFVIFVLLFLHFKNIPNTLMVFSGIAVAWAGGFTLIWLYGQNWFLSGATFGLELRELFNISEINLSVAVWVGFLALFGIATDDGVVMGTYLKDQYIKEKPSSIREVRDAVINGAQRRIRPCLMTTATTLLALLPVLSSTGRGADIMLPMAIPSFGGMLIVQLSVFLVPCLFSMIKEFQYRRSLSDKTIDMIFIIFMGVGMLLGFMNYMSSGTDLHLFIVVIGAVIASLLLLSLLISLYILPLDFIEAWKKLKLWLNDKKEPSK